jgi:Wzt C-terminal domain
VVLHLSDALVDSDGQFDLRDHPARKSGNAPLLTQLTLRDARRSTTGFVTNEEFVAEVTLSTAKPVSQPRVALAVEDAFGRRLFTVANYFTPTRFDEIRGTTRVRCRIPRLRLGAGKYLVSVSVSDPYHGLLDSLDAAGWFTVESHDPYSTGELYHAVYGPVIEDSSWQVQ